MFQSPEGLCYSSAVHLKGKVVVVGMVGLLEQYLFIFKLLVAKRGGEIFDNHYLPSGEHKKFILDCQSAPVLKS